MIDFVSRLGVSLELNTSSLGVKAMALSSTAGNLVKKSSGKVWPEMSAGWLAGCLKQNISEARAARSLDVSSLPTGTT